MRIACFLYTISLCCTPCATSIHSSVLTWLYVVVVQTVATAMSQTIACCSYIILNAYASKHRLLQVNAFAQGVAAVLRAALPLGVEKITALAEMPQNYNSATYFLLFVVGASASILALFGSLPISGRENAKNTDDKNTNQVEMNVISPSCNTKTSENAL